MARPCAPPHATRHSPPKPRAQARGVGAVVSLLSPEELATYAAPGVEAAMRAAFSGHYHNFNLKDAGAPHPQTMDCTPVVPPGSSSPQY